MNIAFDIDGILADFDAGWWKVLQHIRRVSPRPLPEIWNWPLLAGYTAEEIEQSWQRIGQDAAFWVNLKPLPGCKYLSQMCKKLTQRHAVYFITTRACGPLVKQQTERWLSTHLHISPTVLLAKEKGPLAASLDIEVFVEDALRDMWDIHRWAPSTRIFLLDKPHNRTEVALPSSIMRVLNLRVMIQECFGERV